MKFSIIIAACFISLSLARRPPAAVITETIYSCPSAATEFLTLTVALVPNITTTELTAVSTSPTTLAPQQTTTVDVAFEPATIVQTVSRAYIWNQSIHTDKTR